MSQSETGAVRSADSDQLDFTSLPIIGLFGVARTAKEGATKYARLNYMKGFPVHDILNHALIHIYMFLAGDRSEPNLEHAAWGLLAAVQQQTLDPAHSEPHLLGPGATLTTENLNYLAEQEAVLGPKRAAGEFAGLGDWNLSEVPQIAKLLGQRPKPWKNPRFIAKFDGKPMFNSPTMEYAKGGPDGPFEIVRPKQGTFNFEGVRTFDDAAVAWPWRFDFGECSVHCEHPSIVTILPIEAETPTESLDRMAPFQSVNPEPLPTEFDDFRKLLKDAILPEEHVAGDEVAETATSPIAIKTSDGTEGVIGSKTTSRRTIKTGYDPANHTMDGIPVARINAGKNMLPPANGYTPDFPPHDDI